jgi:hypothetical protein
MKPYENLKSTIFWDIPLCSPLSVSGRFGGIHLHLQGQKISSARYQHESRWQVISQRIVLFITTAVRIPNLFIKCTDKQITE